MVCFDFDLVKNTEGFTGDMIYFKVFGQSFLILGNLRRTSDILEQRSSNYSDRPRFPMLLEMSVALRSLQGYSPR